MIRRLALAAMLVALTGANARAQVPFPSTLIPPRQSLGKLGLEKHWSAAVPLAFGPERVMKVSLAGGMIFAQTTNGFLHAFDAESGARIWTIHLGRRTGDPQPLSANANSVFVTNFQELFALEKKTGAVRWKVRLEAMPATATAADDEHVMVGLVTGKVQAYTVKDHRGDKPPGRNEGLFSFAWQTAGTLDGRPVPAERLIAFGSSDGKVYVAFDEPPSLLYRYLTAGPVVGSLGTYGTRTLLIPSSDHNVYAVDLFKGDTLWVFPSGAPVVQEPLVAGDDVYVLNGSGTMFSLDAKTGTARWSQSTGGGDLLAVGATRIYMRSAEGDISLVDRARGQVLFDTRATKDRAGVDLRNYPFALTNAINDRLYFATPSGFILCVRELGETKPRLLRDPKQPPFGYLPPEGEGPAAAPVLPTPGADKEAPAPPEPGPAPATEDKPEQKKEAPKEEP